MLRSITILTTTRCNLACQHCLHGHEQKQQDFPLQLLPKVLQDASILGASHVALTGGEPGLHPQFADMVKDIVESGYTWSFVSNGQQLQPYLPLIETYGEQLRNVSISLDGARPQTHDHIRGMGTFEKAVSAAKAFADTGAKLFLSTSLNRVNHGETEDLVNLAASLGIKTIGFCGTIPTSRNRHLVLNDRECLMLYRQIAELQKSCDINLPIRSSLYTRGGVHFCANLGLRELSFNAHGDLLFCCDMAEDQGIIGSLHTHTLDELIEKWLQTSSDLQVYRMKRITSGRMGEGFDTCAFCDQYFREQYGRIGRRQFLAAGGVERRRAGTGSLCA